MPWTTEQKLDALVKLPWTVVTEANEEEGYLVARVTELEGVLATGATLKLLGQNLWQSLRAVLSCHLEFDDAIPLPSGIVAPWDADIAPAPISEQDSNETPASAMRLELVTA